MLEKDDEKVKGEFESCTKYGRRQEFECTVLFQVGLWSVRNVRRQKMSSASLFDKRRMRGNTNQGGGYSRKDSMESVELGPLIKVTTGAGKVPKSPAPLNLNSV
eukprot:scaffold7923_cov154-Skeletonema_menzelii.AAC.4